ncbi:MAG: YHYH protein [bacterium]|jgi:hypothetical protein
MFRKATWIVAGVLLASGVLVGLRVAASRPQRSDPTQNRVEIRVVGDRRVVVANGIADHQTGLFPNANNPFGIRAQRHRYSMPATPSAGSSPTPMGVREFGVAVNGVAFDPAGPFLNGDQASGWEFEPLHPNVGAHLGVDDQNAHTQPSGAYHYHGMPRGLYERLVRESGGEDKRMILVGWAADGFPIYGPYAHETASDRNSPLREMKSSYRLRSGTRPAPPGGPFDGWFIQDYEFVPGLGDLDECNGRVGVTPEFPGGTFYYMLSREFPVISRVFRGTPDDSFLHPGGGPGPGEVPPGLRDYPRVKPPRE